MKYNILLVSLMLAVLTGCSSGNSDDKSKVVAEINRYRMTVNDLKYELQHISASEYTAMKAEKEQRKYLDRLVEKELLLQEAQRQGIDREKNFMKSIENYWEQALLKLLVERKSKEISLEIYVSNDEIDEYYKKHGETLPLTKIKGQIIEAIKQKKETEAMEAWIEQLKKNAYIKINGDILGEVFTGE